MPSLRHGDDFFAALGGFWKGAKGDVQSSSGVKPILQCQQQY